MNFALLIIHWHSPKSLTELDKHDPALLDQCQLVDGVT